MYFKLLLLFAFTANLAFVTVSEENLFPVILLQKRRAIVLT